MELKEAIRYACDGEAILFLGSGFSFGGKNRNNSAMKVGAGLSHAICDDLKIARSDNLTITATRYIMDDSCKKGLSEFIRFLKGELECTETSKDQDMIISLPWKRIYTTNYDDAVELSSRKQGIIRETITITNARYSSGRNLEQAIIHINGYIRRLNEATFYEEFKITDENYNRDGLLQSTWRQLFEKDLEREKVIVFIGYSLQYDQELVRCIANLNIKEKCIFIDVPQISSDNAFKIGLYGNLKTIGVSGFANEVAEISRSYTPKVKKVELESFEKKDISSYYCEEKYSSIDVVNFLVKGDLKTKFISQKWYCIYRNETIEETMNWLSQKKVVILQSKLGNGKSVFLECLAYHLLEKYNVYMVKNLDSYIEDIQLVQSVPNVENILLVDDYGYYMPMLKEIGKDFPDNLKLILTCRTAININLYYDMVEKYHYNAEDIAIVDLDEMRPKEIKELVKMFNQNRLWGEYDTLSNSQKERKIKHEYGSNMSKIFYLLMKSEPIREQIEVVMQTLNSKLNLKEFVLAQAINSLCRLKLGYSDLCKFVCISDSLLRSYQMDQNVREIIDVENNRFILSSSIYSQYLVMQSNMKKEMINMLGKIYTECSDNDEWNRKYATQRKFLISRSNIKLVFSAKKSLCQEEEQEIFSYYDSIKNLTTATDNPFFWLQFGITSLNLEAYDIARIHFENAYANADKMEDFDSYQIDTHYARLLLCNEMHTNKNSKDNAIDVFGKAHRLLRDNSNRGIKLSYVLRQAGLYFDYFNCYRNMMTEEDCQKFLKKAFEMTERFWEYFNVKELSEIPIEVATAYREYRKLFYNTPYMLPLKKYDLAYNVKVRRREFRIKF